MNAPTTPKFGMGASLRRIEDRSLVTGHGRYTTDEMPEGALAGYVVRAPFAHARFTIGDLSPARTAEGIHLVWTAADVPEMPGLQVEGVGELKPGTTLHKPVFPILCADVVHTVGDAVAFVVADTLNQAKSAAELIDIDYEALPAAVDPGTALDDATPVVWPAHGSNLAFEYERGDHAANEAAFAAAPHTASLRIVNSRLICNYIEPRAVVADYDDDTDRWTLTIGTQGVHGMRDAVAAAMGVGPEKLRVLTYDVGGGFGTKAFAYREYPLAAKAAKLLRKPVKWVSERSEHFLADAHGRDNIAEAALAIDADGRITAMRIDLIANMGAYLSQFGPFIPWLGLSMATGVYDIRNLFLNCKGVFTNTAQVDAYRGAGRPEAAYLIERLIDEGARVARLSREEFRRRNFIRPDQMPYMTVMDRHFDTGDFDGQMTQALEVARYAEFEERAAASRAHGRIRGVGFATYVEACAFAGSEAAKVVLEDDGSVTLHIGTQSNGQGHKTAYAQFVAGPLGLDYDRIRVVQGDTDALPSGGGTGGSRSIPLGVPSVDRASRALADQIKELAARELEAAAGDIELAGGEARIAGTDRRISYAELATRTTDKSPLTAIGELKQTEPTYPNGTHVAEVEIDPDTGQVSLVRYTIVDDFGVVVNPLLLEGQVHGGVAQGVGQALIEHTVYDSDGQLLTATFNDYALPRAGDLPSFRFETRNIPSTWNAMGIKGAGEAGSIGSTPAVMNAVVDALERAYGIRNFDMPATPERVWNAIRAAAN